MPSSGRRDSPRRFREAAWIERSEIQEQAQAVVNPLQVRADQQAKRGLSLVALMGIYLVLLFGILRSQFL
jgi:hypothetical protein